MNGDDELIGKRRQEWIAAVNARDARGYLDLLAEDVVWFPPGQDAFQGKHAFESWLRPFFDRFSYRFAIRDSLLQLAGDWAIERGTFQSALTSLSDGEEMWHEGNYMIIWRKNEDGIWRIERYIDVSPPPEPPASSSNP